MEESEKNIGFLVGSGERKDGFFSKKVYHNHIIGLYFTRLHFSTNYVNKCNFLYNTLWLPFGENGIFSFGVYIKNATFYVKKLSKRGVLGKRLDFFEIFVIMRLQSRYGTIVL